MELKALISRITDVLMENNCLKEECAVSAEIEGEDVILTEERLYEHILLFHEDEYKQLRPYIKNIIENPDYIVEDNRHEDTMIYLKQIEDIGKNGRVVIKLALGQDEEHNKNSIITMMKLNKRTWNQTIKNRGKIIWKNKKD